MSDRQVEVLAGRIARLESANRGLRFANSVTHILVAVLVTTAFGLGAHGGGDAAAPKAIDATAFRLVDAEGRALASLHGSDDGPRFELYDESGVSRASLEHGPEGTALYLRDDSGTTRIGVAQFPHGGGGFAIHGEKSEGAAVLYMSDGRGRLTFYAADGRVTEQIAPPTQE